MDSSQFDGADSKPTGTELKTLTVSVKLPKNQNFMVWAAILDFLRLYNTFKVLCLVLIEFGISALKLSRIQQKSVTFAKMT